MIFGINTTSDISKLLYVISGAVRRVKFEIILKYHSWYLRQSRTEIMLLFVYTTTRLAAAVQENEPSLIPPKESLFGEDQRPDPGDGGN